LSGTGDDVGVIDAFGHGVGVVIWVDVEVGGGVTPAEEESVGVAVVTGLGESMDVGEEVAPESAVV
jgi:hypothetical protein